MFGMQMGKMGGVGQMTLAQRIAYMFANGEQGAWYDPSDLSTIFQDSAGTTPVTAIEQPVGLMLDKSGRNNHAFQATTTKRPVYSRRVNGFTESEFRNGVSDAPTRAGLVTASTLAGYLGALAFGYDGATTTTAYKTNYTVPANITHTISCIVLMDDGLPPAFSGTYNGIGFDFNIAIGGFAVATGIGVDSLGGGFYRVTGSRSVTSANASCGVVKLPTHSTRTFKVTAYDIRPAIDANLPYQRVNTPTDYDTVGFPAYLLFDGVDDALATGSIDFTGTDKMTVWVGVTKLSDAVRGTLMALGIGDGAGSILLQAPYGTASPSYLMQSTGSTSRWASSTAYPSPSTAVLTGISNISGDYVSLRVNASVVATTTTDQGTGNYGNYPFYIGGQEGTSAFFSGRLYSLIVRGAQSSQSQIEATELYIKQKMRLP